MTGHKICFYGKIWLNIPKLSLLPLFIWSTVGDSTSGDEAFSFLRIIRRMSLRQRCPCTQILRHVQTENRPLKADATKMHRKSSLKYNKIQERKRVQIIILPCTKSHQRRRRRKIKWIFHTSTRMCRLMSSFIRTCKSSLAEQCCLDLGWPRVR